MAASRYILAVTAALAVGGPATGRQPDIPKERIPEDMPAAVRGHVERLYSWRPDERIGAIRALGAMGEAAAPATPFLVALIATSEPNTRHAARAAMVQIGRPAVEPTIIALQLGDQHMRRRAVDILQRLADPRAIPALVSAAADELQTGGALSALRTLGEPARDYLLRAVTDADAAVRRRAVTVLAAFPDTEMVEMLYHCLTDADAGVRRGAMRSLEYLLGPSRVESPIHQVAADDRLLAVLADGDAQTRRRALRIIAATKGDRKIPALVAALGDRDASVQMVAMELVGRLGGDKVVPVLTARLASREPIMRAQAARALARTGRRDVVAPLARLLRDDAALVREAVAIALGTLPADEAVEPLLTALRDTDPLVRTRAAVLQL